MTEKIKIELVTKSRILGGNERRGATGVLIPVPIPDAESNTNALTVSIEGKTALPVSNILLKTAGRCTAESFAIVRTGGSGGAFTYEVSGSEACGTCPFNAGCFPPGDKEYGPFKGKNVGPYIKKAH